jgi:reversibly glycosylated polypeptide/UDP-arabinopyranose mutase
VLPTNRVERLPGFFEAWGVDRWDRIIIVEDQPRCTTSLNRFLPPHAIHVSWHEIGMELGDRAWMISRRDSAIRCYGYWLAYKLGADLIVTLDDDCYPTPGGSHHFSMTAPRWTHSIPGYRTRGLPYRNLGELKLHVQQGLWTGVPDLDACQQLVGVPPPELPAGVRVIPRGQYFPMCGMNLAFTHAAAPLMYFPLMGEGSPYGRFDDIWAGVISKKICDHLRWNVGVGEPFVEHRRASDPFKNLVKEAPGVAANEHFWETIDRFALYAHNSTPAACMHTIGHRLEREGGDSYFIKLGKALQLWAEMFST